MEPIRVYLVDDDPSVLRGISRLLEIHGYAVDAYQSAVIFLREWKEEHAACVISDLKMPEMSGLELQAELRNKGCQLPLLILTGHGDIPASVRALRSGALNFLTKPVQKDELLAAVREAVQLNESKRESDAERAEFRRRYESLTPREREVCRGVASGRLNKQIAWDLGTVEKTVKVHRARVMEKMRAGSVAELVRIVDRIKGEETGPTSFRAAL